MKIIPYFLLIVLIGSGVAFFSRGKVQTVEQDYEYLRIHIVANSNSYEDQQVKYAVKNAVVNYLTPYIAECENKEDCYSVINSKVEVLNAVVKNELNNAGFGYSSRCELTKKEFPTRYYENVILQEGEYDCIYIVLGDGLGDNWWCVVYPPLCFVNKNLQQEQDIVYQSKIVEIINKFFD